MQLTEVLDELNIEYASHGESPHVTEGWVGIICPWCGQGTGKYGLGIPLNGFIATCWKCGKHRLAEALVEASGKSYKEVLALIGGLESGPPPKEKIRGKLEIPKGVTTIAPVHRKYLKGRGLDPDEIERLWGVQGIGLASQLKWRLFIPIHLRGEIVSWTTRAIGDQPLRYISAKPTQEKVHHKELLYGEDFAQHSIIICEGPIDVWTIGPGAVCTFGLQYSYAQLDRMSHYPVRAVCFDNEFEAQRKAQKLMMDLSPFPGRTYNITLGTGKDPNSSSKKEVRNIRKRFL